MNTRIDADIYCSLHWHCYKVWFKDVLSSTLCDTWTLIISKLQLTFLNEYPYLIILILMSRFPFSIQQFWIIQTLFLMKHNFWWSRSCTPKNDFTKNFISAEENSYKKIVPKIIACTIFVLLKNMQNQINQSIENKTKLLSWNC